MVWVLPGRKLGPWSGFPFLYRFTVPLNSGGSNSPWSEFWSEFFLFYSADRKRGQRKGATSKNVKNLQKMSKIFSTVFDIFRAGQENSKIVKKCKNIFDTFRQISRGTSFPAPFGRLWFIGMGVVPTPSKEFPKVHLHSHFTICLELISGFPASSSSP